MPSSSPPEALHAQAVRFLTSLRHHSPDSSLESQREFLRSKGLGEDAIEAAFQDAKRPDGLSKAGDGEGQKQAARASSSTSTSSLSEQSAFDQAARAFDDPLHTPMPDVPSRNYPRSPLALYYDDDERDNAALAAAGGNLEEAIRRQEKARRYNVLLSFFRTLCYLFTLGGALTGVAVLLYRSFVLPRLASTLNGRSFLLKHHVGLWDNVVGSVRALKGGAAGAGLGPEGLRKAVTKAEMEAEGPRKGSSERRSSLTKKVQFADEVDGGSLEQHQAGEMEPLLPKKATQMSSTDEDKEKQGKKEGAGQDDEKAALKAEGQEEGEQTAEEEAAKQQELEPIDVCAPIRESLAALVQRLRQDRQDDAASSSVAARATTVQDEEVEEGSDASGGSWEDEEEDVEFDPFVEVHGASSSADKKKSKTAKKAGSGSKAKKSTSTTPPSSSAANVFPADSPLYTSLSSLNASVTARLIASSSAARSFSRHQTAFSFGLPAPASSSDKKQEATGEDKTAELGAQIKAEIRSLKGLMLSRRNFPRANLAVASGRE